MPLPSRGAVEREQFHGFVIVAEGEQADDLPISPLDETVAFVWIIAPAV